MSDITLVTAFFDIGRGNINRANTPDFMTRQTDTYFEYFTNLAQLENEMIVFTSTQFVDKVKQIRQHRPTTIVTFDFDSKLSKFRQKISEIQNDPQFISQVREDLRNNIEYWSSNYALVTNLKTYFVNKAISLNLIKTTMVAWVDFGYVRSPDVLNGVKKWQYNFDQNHIHFFSISKNCQLNSYNDVLDYILNNKIYIIGGVTVGSQEKWQQFLPLLYRNQKELLNNGIVDDDQGLYMMSIFKQPDLFKVNYLGKKQWFAVFRKYDQTSKISIFEKIKDLLM